MAHPSDKKKALLAYKEEILRDIKYFDQRIQEARSTKTNSSYFDEDDDDDDDSDFDSNFLDMGPSITDLKMEQGCLQTCLHATQELTNLYVLQSEVNVLVNDPEYEREPPVAEPGTWREVTADCRVDLVPFSITFYVHQSSRPFGPTSYRGLRVLPVKAAHENELANSILPSVNTPGNAVEVLRSYAVAHRSRRTTLARLAEKYSNSLFMEPMADGGYIIKCANLLEVIWTLENKWSPVAPFHHRMKFDLEYMDEAYVKIISQAHRELSDPTLETDERTRLMSKIIATCLEVAGPSQELYESTESDIEPENQRKRHTNVDEEVKEPVSKKKKDSEIMAPPKSLPKKTKPKGKENIVDNKKNTKTVKRSATDDGSEGAKKIKSNHNNLVRNSDVEATDKVDKENAPLKKTSVNKTSNAKDNNTLKMNGNKEVSKSIAKTKKSNRVNVVKNNDPDSALRKDSAKQINDAKNNAGSSKLDRVKNSYENIKINADKIVNVSETAVGKKNADKQNLKGKTNSEINIPNTNSDKFDNNKKSNKVAGNIPNQDILRNPNKKTNNSDNKAKSSKVSHNAQEINSKVAKVTSSEQQNIESNSQINERPQSSKVSSSQVNIVSKNDELNTFRNETIKKNNSKAKSTDNAKSNVANIDKNKKSVAKSKLVENPKTSNTVSDTDNINTKANLTFTKDDNNDKKSIVHSNAKEKNMKSKSKEELNDVLKTKSTVKNNKPEKDDVLKTSNKQALAKENTKHVTKEKSKISAVNNKNIQTNQNTHKITNKGDFAETNMKNKDTDIKLTHMVKNTKAKPKNTDKILHTNDKTYYVKDDKNVGNLNKVSTKKVGNANKELPVSNAVKTNEDGGRNLLKSKNSNDPVLVANDIDRIKHSKPHLNMKNNIIQNMNKNIGNNKNLRPSKSPIQKSKLMLLNVRNKISIDKFKTISKKLGNATQKGNDQNKVSTKIPQKLTSVREQIVKKNPLRFSPRKPHSNLSSLITSSQNSSRSSLRSIQKPITGIPRLMKKPIHK